LKFKDLVFFSLSF